jgi:hypothetical protein
MSMYSKNHLLIQTFVELDTQISHLTNKISADRFIEIGDDPHLIQEIENVLLRIEHRAKSMEPYFDLSITPMSKANIYFALIKHVSDTIRYLRDVRKKDYGCQQHTHELLKKLKDCSKSIDAIGDLVTVNTEIIH